MKNLFFILFFSFTIASSYAQDKFISHAVKEGETVSSLAKKFGVSENEIYKLNPEVKNKLNANTLLIIPKSDKQEKQEEVEVTFKKHKVRRKETLFSISQKYNITIDDLKKYNKHLYSKGLKKREVLRIPVFTKKIVEKKEVVIVPEEKEETESLTTTHLVLPKETKFGIARKYGISIAELEKLNPSIQENLPMGIMLVVPNTIVSEDSTIIEDENFEYYTVLPKEGFFRLKVKLGLSEEEIVALNPYAKDGLKEGMILKVPKSSFSEGINGTLVNLEDRIINTDRKYLVVLLPFQLHKIHSDSISANEEVLKKSSTLRAAVDFYSGVLMAAEFAKDKGISSHIDVLDSSSNLLGKIESFDFTNVDAVVGPLLKSNIEKASAKLQQKNIPLFSPLSKRTIKPSANLYQTIPSEEWMGKQMLSYIKKHSDSVNVIVISGSKWTKSKGLIKETFPDATYIVPKKDNYFYQNDIKEKLDTKKENWVILDSKDPILVSNVIGLLNGIPKTIYKNGNKITDKENGVEAGRNEIRLFAINKSKAFEYNDISNLHLAKLKFTFPSANKNYNIDVLDPFLVSYKNKYGVLPNRFAVRGFDVTYDILLRLASGDSFTESVENRFLTEYVENKFLYNSHSNKGYENKAFYILRYNDALNLEVVK